MFHKNIINASSKYLSINDDAPYKYFVHCCLSQFVPEKNVINSTKLLKVDNQSELAALCPDKTIDSALTLKFKIVCPPTVDYEVFCLGPGSGVWRASYVIIRSPGPPHSDNPGRDIKHDTGCLGNHNAN